MYYLITVHVTCIFVSNRYVLSKGIDKQPGKTMSECSKGEKEREGGVTCKGPKAGI